MRAVWKAFAALAFSLPAWLCVPAAGLEGVDCTPGDSVEVEALLRGVADRDTIPPPGELMLHFGRHFIGRPYVGKTLEGNDSERLVVNLRQLDCTTLVETALALTMCAMRGDTAFADYCSALRSIRYEGGVVDYCSRLHYFSHWIEANTAGGVVCEVQAPAEVFPGVQTVATGYMTANAGKYPMMAGRPDRVECIARMERRVAGLKRRYIPKGRLADTPQLRRAVRDGDILALTTGKAGLDTQHIGIAVWRGDGLHLLNASLPRGGVVEEEATLARYMAGQRNQVGVRVVRVTAGRN